jgi:glyoxylase-like metal-dependent hydrolase (beta-lactamase superfamily II)
MIERLVTTAYRRLQGEREVRKGQHSVDTTLIQAQQNSQTTEPHAIAAEDLALKANLTTAQMRAGGRVADLTVQSLRSNISHVSGSGGNLLVLPGNAGKLVVDSGLATSNLQMSAALQSISSSPLRYLINTHWHFDHTDGNEWMHEEGATIIANEKTLARMQKQQWIPEFEGVYPPSPRGALPTITFEGTKNFRFNGHEVLLRRYTPAHTDTDISVFFTGADLIHTGDTFFSEFYPFIDYSSGGSIDGMIAACQETLALIGPSTIVVGGHGRAARRSDLVSFRTMLVELRGSVANLKQSGASALEVIARKPTATFDEKWGKGFVSPDLFTWLIYRGV